MWLFRINFILFFVAACLARVSWADDLGVGFYLGFHKPALEDLNQGEFKSPLGGIATVLTLAGQNETVKLNFKNPLPDLGPGITAGLEFNFDINDDYSILFGGGTWEATSRALVSGGLYVQGASADVIQERSAKVSYNEMFFGIKRNVANINDNIGLYYRLTLNEVFDIDYREDMVFLYTSGKAEGIKKTVVLQSQATGLLMLQPGFGVNYKLQEWVTIGLEASYVVGFKRVTLRDGTVDSNFLPTDNLIFWLPHIINEDDRQIDYLLPDPQLGEAPRYKKMRLSFDGWKTLLKLKMYF